MQIKKLAIGVIFETLLIHKESPKSAFYQAGILLVHFRETFERATGKQKVSHCVENYRQKYGKINILHGEGIKLLKYWDLTGCHDFQKG